MGKNSVWIIGVLLLALVLRLGWTLSRPTELAADLPDQAEYLAIGRNVLMGQGMYFHDPRFDADVYAFRSPGYPLLIAGMGGSIRAVRIAQALLDTLTVLAIFLLARRWLDPCPSLLAAAIVAFNPFLIYFSGLILSETLFTCLIAWGLAMLARRQIVVGSILFALAVLLRPVAIPLAVLACAFASWRDRQVLRNVAISVAAIILFSFPWALRNHQLLHQWIWTTTNSGQTAYDGFGPAATGESNLASLASMPELTAMSETDRDAALAQQAREAIKQDPVRAIRLAVAKIARTWSPIPLSTGYGSARNRVISLTYATPLFILTLVGLFGRGLSTPAKMVCLLPAIYFTTTVAVSVGSLRYRIPAEPPMAVVAASVFVRRKNES